MKLVSSRCSPRWGSFAPILGALLLAPPAAGAQVVGDPNNSFGGVGTPYSLTWGANDGAACTVVGAPTDNGYPRQAGPNKSIIAANCAAARFDYYSNGWADLTVWNRNGQEGTNAASMMAGFGLFWCNGTSGPSACPFGQNLLGATGLNAPTVYNDGIYTGTVGNWYSCGNCTHFPTDFRLINGAGIPMVSQTGPGLYTTNVLTDGCFTLNDDGWCDASVVPVTPAETPYTSLSGLGGFQFQFFLGTGFDFSSQWLVLDVGFQYPAGGNQPVPNSSNYYSCIDDRYVGSLTSATTDAADRTNSGCGGLAGGGPLESVVPEPGSLLLLGTGLIGLAPLVRRRRRQT